MSGRDVRRGGRPSSARPAAAPGAAAVPSARRRRPGGSTRLLPGPRSGRAPEAPRGRSFRVLRQRLRSRRLLVLASVVAALAVGSWLLLLSDVLAVRTVVVEGARTVPEAEVRARLGAVEGVPLARVPTGELAATVAALPRVATARVDRRWPRTLAVVVTERVPVAVRAGRSGYEVLDREAQVVATAPGRPSGLPLLQASASSGPGLTAALGVLTALPPPVLVLVESASAASPNAVELGLRAGGSVRWGDAEQATRKARVLEVLVQREPRAQMYDVSAPDTPTTRG